MSKTVEELLVPRYEVIADYPMNNFTVGFIICFEPFIGPDSGKTYWQYKYAEYDGIVTKYKSEFEEYPHLFRELHWSEFREIDDMPEYVKKENKVKKVFKHFVYMVDGTEHEAKAICSFKEINHIGENVYWRYDQCTPATFIQYTNYINSKK